VSRRLEGRVALITGAARGIGLSTARLFLREGAWVGLLDHDATLLRATAASLAAEFGAQAVGWRAADIADAAAISTAIEALANDFGGVDSLVNNAAAREFGHLADATPESWARILRTNVVGLSNCCAAALPFLRRSGQASIVNVLSVFALVGRTNMGLYDATKAAALAMTRVLACEEAAHGVRVNAVCPGSTLTPWTEGRAAARGMTLEELRDTGAMPNLLGRWAEADEIAYPILWLASAEASYITGVALPIDGGLSAM
jgi:meso-butanediol dehydrogenase/(S,S)-butanediol dehydrogenase/diacetyl reductase